MAQREDKPIFLSIGYSSCHWCHVMAHESFEDDEVARVLNDGFVSIKVDREQHPDVDDAYMAAVHLTNGRGGWPMSVFLMPDLKPFFAGTYFPKDQFLSILRQVQAAWLSKRPEVEQVADEYAKSISRLFARPAPQAASGLSLNLLVEACQAIMAEADLENGGFGSRPKFPPHTTIALFLDLQELPLAIDADVKKSALALALHALQSMAEGGIHDHVGGGFHRYSVDERWFLPHFEKMLYDNALMLSNYARGASLAMNLDPQCGIDFRSIARRIVSWLERELKLENGLYGSALDADTNEGEGWYYTWAEAEIDEVLGSRSAEFEAVFGIRSDGNCHDEATGKPTGRNIVYARSEEAQKDWNACLDALLSRRLTRTPPMRDGKCIVGWNGLAVKGLVDAQNLLLAQRVAEALLEAEQQAGFLPHIVGDSAPAYLDDYAYLAEGLYSLGAATGNPRWRQEAERLTSKMVDLFWDSKASLFRSTSSAHQELFGRSAPVFDQPAPSGNAIAIRCLVHSYRLEMAGKALEGLAGWMAGAPGMCEGLIHTAFLFIAAGTEPMVATVDGALLTVHLALPSGQDILHAGDAQAEAPRLFVDGNEVPVDRVESTSNGWRISGALKQAIQGGSLIKVRFQACTDRECLPVEERSVRFGRN